MKKRKKLDNVLLFYYKLYGKTKSLPYIRKYLKQYSNADLKALSIYNKKLYIEDLLSLKSKGNFDHIAWNQRFYCLKNKIPFENELAWINDQLIEYRKGNLYKHLQLQLESIPGWKWDRRVDLKWEKNFQELKRIYDNNEMISHYEKIATWKEKQIARYRRGVLEDDRIKKLESIIGWKWETVNDIFIWMENFNKLKEFIKANKEIPKVEKHLLGRWASKQRYAYNRGKLSDFKIKTLEQLSLWKWKVSKAIPNEVNWRKKYKKLLTFIKKNNRYPRSHREQSMFSWITTQRQNYIKNNLSQKRIEMLEKLEGWKWKTKD